MEWARLQRCANALPHQAPQLGQLDVVKFPELAQRQTLLEFLKTAKLEEYHQALRENLGLRLGDVPFVQPHDLVAGGLKEFHQKRFMRFARRLPISPLQEHRYDEDWIRRTEAVVNPEALAAAHRANLVLVDSPIDRYFLNDILNYRRMRQLADPEYAMSTAARQKLRGRLCSGGFHAEREEARRKVAATTHARGGSVIVEAIWQGELSLDEIRQRLIGLGFPQGDNMHRLAELILHADDNEFDDDVRAEERVIACDERHAEGFFQDELVKLRRIRQLTFPARAIHQHPSFHGDTPEEEKTEVRRVNLPQWERAGWDLAQAVEKMWAGEFRLKELAAGADANSTYVIKKMMTADAPEYAQDAKKKHREDNGLVPEDKLPEVAALMATLATRPAGNGTLEYERTTSETELFPALHNTCPDAGDAILRIWAGERDLAALSADKPPLTRGFIAQILSHLDGGDGGAASEEAITRLVGFTGRSRSEVKMCLEAAGGDEAAAASMLLGA
jgi:hypothetical protein